MTIQETPARFGYVKEFLELCEYIPVIDMPDIVPKIVDVLPYVLECEFGIDWGSRRSEVLNLLRDGAFESALMSIIPCDIIVASTMQKPWTFTFSTEEHRLISNTFTSDASSYSMAMLCTYLKYLCEVHGALDEGGGKNGNTPSLRVV
ncbi:MAG: hypothetical protein NTX28_06755 [Novosphingobium sp.]|nr:hypothetical protein [Novosphingobium sp.]